MIRTSALFFALILGFSTLGCGSKKAKVTDADGLSADGGVTDLEAEANTGPTTYASPPTQSPSNRTPYRTEVSVTKAFVLPLAEDGRCWDGCNLETKKALADSMVQLATIDKPGDKFNMASKAVGGRVGSMNGQAALPDLYVHLDCGNGQQFETAKTSAQDRLAAQWRGAAEVLQLDRNDMCAISVMDADETDDDEMIGSLIAPILQKVQSGKIQLFGADENFGQVYLVELEVKSLEGPPLDNAANNTNPGSSTTPPDTSANTTPPQIPSGPGRSWYAVEIVKANLKGTKKSGQPWDAKIPFIGGGDGKLPDPFVQGFVNGYQSAKPFMSTPIKKDANYHEWRTAGKVELKIGDKIHFMVWDKDMADNDLMGTCISDPVHQLSSGQEIVFRGCGQVDFLVVKITKQ